MSMNIRVLVTSFEPFGCETINPSELVAQRLTTPPNATLRRVKLPVLFGRSFEQLLPILQEYRPDYVLLLGQAGGRDKVTVEKVAINYAQTKDSDIDNVIIDNTISQQGATGIFATLPTEQLCEVAQKRGLPCALSFSAGTYVCNYLMYRTLEYCATQLPTTKVGFIHIPYIEEQMQDKTNVPYLSLDVSIDCIQTIVNTLCSRHTAE